MYVFYCIGRKKETRGNKMLSQCKESLFFNDFFRNFAICWDICRGFSFEITRNLKIWIRTKIYIFLPRQFCLKKFFNNNFCNLANCSYFSGDSVLKLQKMWKKWTSCFLVNFFFFFVDFCRPGAWRAAPRWFIWPFRGHVGDRNDGSKNGCRDAL